MSVPEVLRIKKCYWRCFY